MRGRGGMPTCRRIQTPQTHGHGTLHIKQDGLVTHAAMPRSHADYRHASDDPDQHNLCDSLFTVQVQTSPVNVVGSHILIQGVH